MNGAVTTTWTWLATRATPRSRPDRKTRLAERARQGDRHAFGALWRQHARLAHAILLSMVPAQDAEDLLQDVALRSWARIRDLRDPTRFTPWIAEIARNAGRRALARRKQAQTRTLEDDDEVTPTAPPASLGAEADEVLTTIRALPQPYREPLLLRLMLGLSGPEIAARLAMTPGSVRVNLCRGMRQLRERLEPR